jgi:flagellar biosynthesis/type III secretory pathway chaperone
MLNAQPRPSAANLIETYKVALHLDEFPSETSIRAAKETINDFSAFCKRIAPVLSKIKKQSRMWGPIKERHNQSFQQLIELLVKYEEETITTYADSNANKLVLGDINDT